MQISLNIKELQVAEVTLLAQTSLGIHAMCRLQVPLEEGEEESDSLMESRISSSEWAERQSNGVGPNGERDSRRRGLHNSRSEAEMTPLIPQQR